MSQDRRNAGTRWVMLGLGIAVTLAGAWNAVRGSSGPDVPNLRESMASPQDTGALPPVSGGTVLAGTILSARLAEARTIVADMRGRQRVYARGDAITDGGKVLEIHRDYIVLRRNGRREMLEFSWNAVVRVLERSARGTQGTVQETPPGDDLEVLREAMFTHPELLLQLIGATPVFEGERFLGYRVMKPEDTAFLESLGLKPGDVLIAVNGAPLNTPDYGAELLEAMSGTGKLTFTVRRGSEILVLSN
jgi:type II secretion system protein C